MPEMPAGAPPHHLGPLGRLLALTIALAAGCADPISDAGAGLGLVPFGEVSDPTRPWYHDFGEVAPGTPLEHTFEFENASALEVSVLRMASSCSCTVPRLEARLQSGELVSGDPYAPDRLLALPPGAVGRITLRVDPASVRQANRDKLVTVRLTTDSPDTPYISLEAHLVVREHFQVAPPVADLGQVATGAGTTFEVTMTRFAETGHTIGRVLGAPPGLVASVGPHPTGEGRSWILTLRLDPGLEPGAITGSVQVETIEPDGSSGPPIEVPLGGLIVPDVGFTPHLLAPRPIDGGIAHEVRLHCRIPGRALMVESVRLLGPLSAAAEVTATPVEPDPLGRSDEWIIRLSGPAELAARDWASDLVEVLIDDPDHPRIEIPVSTSALH
jgi:hypothetical protein